MIDTTTKLSMLQERFSSKAEYQYAKALDEALGNIMDKIRTTESDTMRRRLIIIRSLIEKEIGAINGVVIPSIQEDMAGFAELNYQAMFTTINQASGMGYAFVALPASTIKEIIDMKEVRLIGDKGYTLEDMFNTMESGQIDRYKQIINAGLAGNIGYREITQNLKKANETGMNNISAIVHTAISSARDKADAKVYDKFSSIITGWKSISVLDSKTSLLCASMDGVKYMKGKVDKYGNLITDFNSIKNRPPRHWRCRSKLAGLTMFSDDDGTRSQNGDKAGQISSGTDFSKWFSKQSPKFQSDYLGKSRYDLYNSGRLKINDFVDIKSGKKFTLQELKEII